MQAWLTLLGAGGSYADLLVRMGATEVVGRTRGCWPMGSLLISKEDATPLPALGIYIEPIVVQSAPAHGVQWTDPTTVDVESAWLLEQVVSYG